MEDEKAADEGMNRGAEEVSAVEEAETSAAGADEDNCLTYYFIDGV